jgi:hypothetical protein
MMAHPLLSICIPSVSLDEIVFQLREIEKITASHRENIEILVKLDKSSDADIRKANQAAKNIGASLVGQTNEGFDNDIGHLINAAKGRYIWLVSSNDRPDEACLADIMPVLKKDEFELVFLNSRTSNGEDTAITVTSDLELNNLGPVLKVIGTRMSLITSIIFRNSDDQSIADMYRKYSMSAVAFLVYPFCLLANGGKTYVFSRAKFTNHVRALGVKETTYYDGVITFGQSLWDMTLEFRNPNQDRDTRDFLVTNFGHIWRGLMIDWLRREMPRPTAQLWSIRQYRISREYWLAIMFSLLPKQLARIVLSIYKFFYRQHY